MAISRYGDRDLVSLARRTADCASVPSARLSTVERKRTMHRQAVGKHFRRIWPLARLRGDVGQEQGRWHHSRRCAIDRVFRLHL